MSYSNFIARRFSTQMKSCLYSPNILRRSLISINNTRTISTINNNSTSSNINNNNNVNNEFINTNENRTNTNNFTNGNSVISRTLPARVTQQQKEKEKEKQKHNTLQKNNLRLISTSRSTSRQNNRIPQIISNSRREYSSETNNIETNSKKTRLILDSERESHISSSPCETVNMVTALNDVLRITLSEDPTTCIFGEDVAFGGVFRVTQNLRNEFGNDRVFNSPLSEQGIIGFGIGLASLGHTAIAEIQFADYIMPAWDQIINECSKFRYRSASDFNCGKLTIRTASNGVGHGGLYHSQSPESYFAHCPGIKLVYPSGPYNSKGLLRASINDPNPVIFFEPKRMYSFPREDVPIEDYELELSKANILKNGNDITMIGWGALLNEMKIACDYIEDIYKTNNNKDISIELIDLQTILPFDEDTIINSVKKTGKCIICHEATLTQGMGAEIAATIQESCFLHLEAPIQRVTGFDTPNGLIYEPIFMPNRYKIYEAVKKCIEY